jgi:LytS/YehU family sensor histidine kinase
MTIRLGAFLRSSLRLADRDFITLAEEIDLARSYLEIESTRFGDRLEVRFDTDEANGDFPVPSLLLQPLLENSIKHGLAGLVEGGAVTVSARPRGERLRLEVANPVDPESASSGASTGEGIGLKNVIGRLEVLYRGHAQLEVFRAPDGFRVTIDLPDRDDGAQPRVRP